uniref:Uncharacterized protein n=1 Tax=Lactuca sativa TaxID=4236 RepID=A0A9R1WM49_LACSA|nr:hypothetical protein LSAT_V11C100041140 [Lactuca sativa]
MIDTQADWGLTTRLKLEVEAVEFFTRNVFFDIQSEILASIISFMSIILEEFEELKTFTIKDIDNHPKHHGQFEIPNVHTKEKKEEIQSVIQELEFAMEFCIDRLVNDFDKLILFRDEMNEKMKKVDNETKNTKSMKNS